MASEFDSQRRGVVAVITQRNQFLVIRRSLHVRAPGAYCFPGGGIEPGETEPVALCRELWEELGTEVRALTRLWRNRTPSGVQLAWWRAELAGQSPLAPNPAEVASYHWYSSEQILKLHDLLPTNREFFQALDRGEFKLYP